MFGDRLEEVERRVGEKAPAIADPDEQACRQVEFKTYPGVWFMVEGERVTRADSSKPVKTSIGYSVGASMAEIKRHFPRAIIDPHHYEQDGHYITVKNRDGKSAILMEEVRGTITEVRGGLIPSVQYVEGCL